MFKFKIGDLVQYKHDNSRIGVIVGVMTHIRKGDFIIIEWANGKRYGESAFNLKVVKN